MILSQDQTLVDFCLISLTSEIHLTCPNKPKLAERVRIYELTHGPTYLVFKDQLVFRFCFLQAKLPIIQSVSALSSGCVRFLYLSDTANFTELFNVVKAVVFAFQLPSSETIEYTVPFGIVKRQTKVFNFLSKSFSTS